MSPSVRTQTTNTTFLKYHQLLQETWTCKAEDGQDFILVSELENWMRRRDTNVQQPNGGILLDLAYSQLVHNQINQIDWSTVCDQRDSCVLVFALLLKLGYGHLVHIFKRVGLYDRNLGAAGALSSESNILEELQRNNYGVQESRKIFGRFAEHQWAYAPVKFELGLDKNFHANSVFPFCRKEIINEGKGATARLWQVAVRKQFVEQNLREHVEGTEYDDKDHGMCYRFVVKEFAHEHKDIFKAESEAFTALSPENGSGMIRCFGKYQQLGTSATHNILLEYGEQDLDEFFDDHYPPVLTVEVIAFWEELIRVADALDRVHRRVDKKRHGGQVTEYYGWHADIKPDNILRVGLKFKLADFGFAKFERKRQTILYGGTDTYAAPELFRAKQGGTFTPVSQGVDIWSFACVLSVSVTWVVLGSQGLKQYQSVREDAIRRLKRPQQTRRTELILDAFHNGTTVLDEVTHWHDYLRRLVRQSDTMSLRILDLLDQSMLLGDTDKRISSDDLCLKLADISALGQMDAEKLESRRTPIAGSILTSIIEFNREAPATMDARMSLEITVKERRQNRSQNSGRTAKPKSKPYENIIAGKVAHRQVLQKQVAGLHSNFLDPIDGQSQGNYFVESPIQDENEDGFNSPTPSPLSPTPSPLTLRKSHNACNAGVQETSDNISTHQRHETAAIPAHACEYPSTSYHELPGASFQEGSMVPSSPELPQPPQPHDPGMTAPQHTQSPISNTVSRQPTVGVGRAQVLRVAAQVTTPSSPLERPEPQQHRSIEPTPTFQESPPGPLLHHDAHGISARSSPFICQEYLTELRKRQKGFKAGVSRRLGSKKDAYLKVFLTDRDIHFVVDNGKSMIPYWGQVVTVLECLVRMVDGLDDDGVDLTFPFRQECNRRKIKGKGWKNAAEVVLDATEKAKPRADEGGRDRQTDMAKLLGSIFDKYQNGKMTLIILTDGNWGGETEENETEKKIAQFLKGPAMQKVQEDRKVSIEFVSFGTANTAKMDRLDDKMKETYEVPDVIDHEPWNGSPRKMILGSFDKAFDTLTES